MALTTVQAKSIFTSTTFYAAILALLSAVDPALYAKVLSSLGVNDPNLIVSKIVDVIAFGVVVYGRWSATQPLALKTGLKTVEIKPTPIPPAKLGV